MIGENKEEMFLILPVHEILRLLLCADQLDDRIEDLAIARLVLLLLLEHEHEVVSEAALHHHPVDRSGQVDVCSKEHDVLP